MQPVRLGSFRYLRRHERATVQFDSTIANVLDLDHRDASVPPVFAAKCVARPNGSDIANPCVRVALHEGPPSSSATFAAIRSCSCAASTLSFSSSSFELLEPHAEVDAVVLGRSHANIPPRIQAPALLLNLVERRDSRTDRARPHTRPPGTTAPSAPPSPGESRRPRRDTAARCSARNSICSGSPVTVGAVDLAEDLAGVDEEHLVCAIGARACPCRRTTASRAASPCRRSSSRPRR